MALIHSPRLDTIKMIETAIEKHSGEFGKYQLWRILPKSVMYQTYQGVLEYLEESLKISYDRNGKIAWIFEPDSKKYSNSIPI